MRRLLDASFERCQQIGCAGLSRGKITPLVVLVGFIVTSGCSDSPPVAAESRPAAAPPGSAVPQLPKSAVPAEVPAAAATANAPAAQPAPDGPATNLEPPRSGSIIGRTTQDVRDAEKEQAIGAKQVKPKITGGDPISISGSAYSAIIGRTEILQIQHSLDLYKALNDRFPKDYDEFYKEIIRANGIRLAQLPYYQKYGYEPVKHELVILEYPH